MVRLPLSPNAGFASDRSALRMPPKSVFVDVVVGGLLDVLRQFHPGLFGVFSSLYFSRPEWSFRNIFAKSISHYSTTQLRIIR